MPYSIRKKGKGYKVCIPSGKCFSKKPLTLKTAKKQLSAIKSTSNEIKTFDVLVRDVLAEKIV